ncbi:Acyl-CoA:lysophosphatidylglycerol acyltransferase 1 [Eumeta japonica]|uniref:Acyl-CoA:lysophosphatidylglycerol acyltransferase 1 n=1 Tax=Eumeta variegata TaxID=151549 RepID=A0A4C1V713_EUMVA|nr:Acyl-CoA:lysophosphatidylglycerol acyltransferase 1 [Eumeta japonica]
MDYIVVVVESGDEPSACDKARTLVLANHQSTADVPMLMSAWNARPDVLPNLTWIMDRVFKFTNFGIVSVLHADFFIQAFCIGSISEEYLRRIARPKRLQSLQDGAVDAGGFTSVLLAFWVEIGYMMEGQWDEGEERRSPKLSLIGRNAITQAITSRVIHARRPLRGTLLTPRLSGGRKINATVKGTWICGRIRFINKHTRVYTSMVPQHKGPRAILGDSM